MQNNEPLCSDRSSTIDVSSISSLTVSWFSLSSLKKQINNNFLFQTVSSNKYTTNHLFALYWTDFLNSKHRLWCVHMSLRSMPRLYISLERLLGFKWPSVVLSVAICGSLWNHMWCSVCRSHNFCTFYSNNSKDKMTDAY